MVFQIFVVLLLSLICNQIRERERDMNTFKLAGHITGLTRVVIFLIRSIKVLFYFLMYFCFIIFFFFFFLIVNMYHSFH